MRKSVILIVGVIAVLVGMGFVMPAIAQLRDTGALPTVSVGLLLLGLTLTCTGCGAVALSARRLRT